MNPLRSWAARTARSLSAHLDRLRDTLLRLHGRLREAVADAVGGSVADAAQDAVRAALLHPVAAPAGDARPFRHSSCAWDGPSHHNPWAACDEEHRSAYWPDRRYDEPSDSREPDQECDDQSSTMPTAPSDSRARRWSLALAAGCQAAAWWLRRGTSRFTALAALGVGVASALAAYAVGPVVAAGAGLASSALALAALSDATRAAGTLFRFATS